MQAALPPGTETVLTHARGHAVELAREWSPGSRRCTFRRRHVQRGARRGRRHPGRVHPGGGTSVLPGPLGCRGAPGQGGGRVALGMTRRIPLGTVNGRRVGFNAGIGFDAELVRRVDALGRRSDGKRPGRLPPREWLCASRDHGFRDRPAIENRRSRGGRRRVRGQLLAVHVSGRLGLIGSDADLRRWARHRRADRASRAALDGGVLGIQAWHGRTKRGGTLYRHDVDRIQIRWRHAAAVAGRRGGCGRRSEAELVAERDASPVPLLGSAHQCPRRSVSPCGVHGPGRNIPRWRTSSGSPPRRRSDRGQIGTLARARGRRRHGRRADRRGSDGQGDGRDSVPVHRLRAEDPLVAEGELAGGRRSAGGDRRPGEQLLLAGPTPPDQESLYRPDRGRCCLEALQAMCAAPTVRMLRSLSSGSSWRESRGSGPAGRITEADVRQAATAGGAEGVRIPVEGTAARSSSRSSAPTARCRRHLRRGMRLHRGGAVAAARDDAPGGCRVTPGVPELNARVDGDEIVLLDRYDLGIAVSTDAGLVIPVVRDCDTRSVEELDFGDPPARKRRPGRDAHPDDVRDSTFSVTSAGSSAACS